jgi:hypothetical protein
LDSFISEIKILVNLESLVLSNNLITNLNKEWLKYFSNLKRLDMKGNNLFILEETLFDGNQRLTDLVLSNNKFSDLSAVTKALTPIKNTLTALFLARNSFKSIESNSLQSLSALQILDLGNNQIENIDENSFNNNKELIMLFLNGNLLKKIPNIKNLTKLFDFDMRNQKGQLTELVDYAFERNSYDYPLSLSINSNKIVKFGNKTFCARNSLGNIFERIAIDYDSMKLIDKCLLKQLRLFTSMDYQIYIDVVSSTQLNSYTDVCNCNLKAFLSKFNINLIGVCSQVNLTCSNTQVVDDCISKREYLCDNPNLSTTTSTPKISNITTNPVTTMTTSPGFRLNQSYLLSSLGILLFTTLIATRTI